MIINNFRTLYAVEMTNVVEMTPQLKQSSRCYSPKIVLLRIALGGIFAAVRHEEAMKNSWNRFVFRESY